MRQLKFRIPVNLDVDKLYVENKEKFLGKTGFKKDKLLFVLDALAKSRANQSKKMEEEDSMFAPLWSRMMSDIVHDYKDYINFLLATNVWSTDSQFIRGEKCIGYCYQYPYNGQRMKTVDVTDFTLKKAIRKATDKFREEQEKALKEYEYLTKWWTTGKLGVYEKRAHKCLEDYYSGKLQELRNSSLTGEEYEKRRARIINILEDQKYLVSRIGDGTYLLPMILGEADRMYSPITNLKKEARNFLTYDGQQLVELDLKNSQPFFAIALFRLLFWKSINGIRNKKTLKYINNDMYNNIISNSNYYNVITLVDSIETQASTVFGVNEYIEKVCSGTFYDYIQPIFEEKFPGRYKDRSEVKKAVLKAMYINTNRRNRGQYAELNVLKALFPGVFELFALIKKSRYQILPLILQRIESYLVLDVVCKKIGQISPDILMLTVHDNIITTKGNEQLVYKIFAEEIEAWIGAKPIISINDLTTNAEQPHLQEPAKAPQIRQYTTSGLPYQYFYKIGPGGNISIANAISEYLYDFHYTHYMEENRINVEIEKIRNLPFMDRPGNDISFLS